MQGHGRALLMVFLLTSGQMALQVSCQHRRRIKTEEKAKVVAVFCMGTELVQFLAALAIFHQDYLKKRTKRTTASCGMDALEKRKIILFTPNHHPTKRDVLPKTFDHFILTAKWLVRHSSMSPTNSDDLCLLFCLNPSSGK